MGREALVGDLPGWAKDDHAAALIALARLLAPGTPAKRRHAPWLTALTQHLPVDRSRETARAWFETWFRPARPIGAAQGFVTGYFEPELEASRRPTPRFKVPLYHRPPELVRFDPPVAVTGARDPIGYGRRDGAGQPALYDDRAAIEAGALAGRGLEIAFVENEIDAFFVHIQGSARLSFPDGSTTRLAFAAKSGHPYTPIGRALVERGELSAGAVDMDAIRSWLARHPGEARDIMQQNRSFIFFRETDNDADAPGPTGAAGVPLTPLRSLAVDHDLTPYGTPVWIDAELPLGPDGAPTRLRRLMIAQDTGSAIVGPARGDIFVGSGDAAGAIAGRLKHAATFVPFELRPEAAARLCDARPAQ